MGLLNNWLNKKKKEQLQNTGDKPAKLATEKKEEKKEQKAEKESKPKKILPVGSVAYKVLVKPLVTEKSAIAESVNKYSFEVAIWSNKLQVKQAIKEIYGVMPASVNIVNVDGKAVRFGRMQGRRSGYKKAIITLPKGKTIDIHAGV